MPKNKTLKKIFLAGCCLLTAGNIHAAGFQINLQGLRQLAMGNTGVAYPWDNAVIFYNPGALSRLENSMISGSIFGIFPATQLVQPATGNTSSSVSQTFTPFNLYLSTPVKKVSGLSLGLGVYTPFGTGLKWDDEWSGRYVTQNIGLQSIFFQPTAGYRINKWVSIGAGFVYATGNFHLNKAIPLQFLNGDDGQAMLKGNANGMGYNVGAHFQLHPKINAGLSYRSGVRMKVKNGDATFRVPSSVATNFPTTTFNTELSLPSVLSIGFSAQATRDLTISLEGNFVGWKSYDTLRFDYADQTSALQNTRAPRLYKNTATVRLGLLYALNSKVDLMAGGAYDASPVSDNFVSPDLPDADRMVFTAGLNVKAAARIDINGVVEFVNAQKRDGWYEPEAFGGTYQTKAFTIGIGASYKFKK